MPPVVLDTDVFSFFFKRDTRAALYEPALRDAALCLSFQSVAELRLWSLVRRWGQARRDSLEAAFVRYTVLPADDAMSHTWAGLTAHRRRLGRPIETSDAWIAASALRHAATLLTHNGQHYADIPGLRVVITRKLIHPRRARPLQRNVPPGAPATGVEQVEQIVNGRGGLLPCRRTPHAQAA